MSELTGLAAFEFLFEQYTDVLKRLEQMTAARDELRNSIMSNDRELIDLKSDFAAMRAEIALRAKGDAPLSALIQTAKASVEVFVAQTTRVTPLDDEQITNIRTAMDALKDAVVAAKPYDPDPIPF